MFGQGDPAEAHYRASLATFEKLAAAIRSRMGSARATRNPDSVAEPRTSPQVVPLAGRHQPGGSAGSGTATRGLSLISSTFFPGAGGQRQFPRGRGIAVTRDTIYLCGTDADRLRGYSLAICYERPVAGQGQGAPELRWSTHWPQAGFPLPGGEKLTGVVATEEGAFFVGTSYHETSDLDGGKEGKGVVVKFGAEGPVGPEVGGAEWVARPSFFPYSGIEVFHNVAGATHDGSPFLYVVGNAETFADRNKVFVLAKYDTLGRFVARVTEPGVRFDEVQKPGYSRAIGVTALKGRVYVAGQSGLRGLGEDPSYRPFLACYDGALTPMWKQRDENVVGLFEDVTGADGALYAVGWTKKTGVANSEDYLVQKYSENSTRLWSVEFGGDDWDQLTGVAIVGKRLFAVGYTKSEGAGGEDAVLFEIDPADGKILSKTLFGGPEDDRANGVATDGTDLYVVGTSGSFAPGGTDANGQSHVMLLHYALDFQKNGSGDTSDTSETNKSKSKEVGKG